MSDVALAENIIVIILAIAHFAKMLSLLSVASHTSRKYYRYAERDVALVENIIVIVFVIAYFAKILSLFRA